MKVALKQSLANWGTNPQPPAFLFVCLFLNKAVTDTCDLLPQIRRHLHIICVKGWHSPAIIFGSWQAFLQFVSIYMYVYELCILLFFVCYLYVIGNFLSEVESLEMCYLLRFLLLLKFLELFLVVAYIFRYSFPFMYTSHRLTSFRMREGRADGGSVTLTGCCGFALRVGRSLG
jgi:hypothetical protein